MQEATELMALARGFRIEVAADSLVEMDEATEKQNRLEFLTSVGTFMERVLPVAQQVPELAPLMGEMLMFGVRAFKGGRSMEAAFDSALAKLNEPKPQAEPQPDPEQMKMQAMAQAEQVKAQIEQAKLQTQGQIEQFKAMSAQELEQMRQEYETAREKMKQDAETQRAEIKARIDAETKLIVAQMQTEEKTSEQAGIENEQKILDIEDQIRQIADVQKASALQGVQMLADVVAKMNKPKQKILQRGADGKAVGVIEVEIENESD
jgi:DNA repair exonuclease SbcCD ATPase subunit